MNLCGLPTIMRKKPTNLIHIVFDNGIYESSGGTKTATTEGVDFVSVAKGVGIKNSFGATSTGEFKQSVCRRDESLGTCFSFAPESNRAEAKYRPGRGRDVRVSIAFTRHVEQTEGISILTSAPSRKLEEEVEID